MPVRRKAVDALIKSLHGSVVYNNVDFTLRLDDEYVDREATWERYDASFVSVIESIDWNRVMLEATGCHLARQELDSAHMALDFADELCPDCVSRALLADETFIDWRKYWQAQEEYQ